MFKFSKIKTVFLCLFLISVSYFLLAKTNSSVNIVVPDESAESIKRLDRAISRSKFNLDSGIIELESLKNLSEYTEYKKKYILARLYEKKKNTNQAIELYEGILVQNYPLKERALFHLAVLSASQGDDKRAIKYFTELLKLFPDSKSVPQAKYYLAQTQLRLRYIEDGVETLRSIKADYSKSQYGIATNYYLGEYEYNKQNYSAAVDYWRDYLKNSPDGRFANEIVDLVTTQKNVSLKPSDYSLLGDVYFFKKDYKKAAHFYSFDNNPRKYYNLGYSYFRLGEKSKAEHYLKEFAYSYPRSKNAKWALYYCAKSMPSFVRKSFWAKVTKDIPELAYYTIYKEGMVEESDYKREEIFKKLMELYPQGEFTLDAVWEMVWNNIKNKNYARAEELGQKYFDANEKSINANSESRLKIGFWLGKIAEINKRNFDAIEHYKKLQNINSDNYYYYRAKYRLLALTGGSDPMWNEQFSASDYKDFDWSIPVITKLENLQNHYGVTVAELINLQQFDEAIELIGKNKSPSKQVTAWLKALNNECDTSINIANLITNRYSMPKSNPIWQLAYPLYYWQYILSSSAKYQNLDPLLAAGVIRQESRFDSMALSVSNAFGLMQLIIPTARVVAGQVGIPFSSQEMLHDPKTNISLGVHYLNGLIGELNNPLYAVASYNAGPNAVKNWINKNKGEDLDFFVEKIPYDETRNYVKKVFSSYWTYLSLYKG